MLDRLDSTTIVALAAVGGVLVFLDYFFGFRSDPKEPPVISPTIPWVGHILGLARYGLKYFTRLSVRYSKPIYTLPLLSSRMYIITDPSLVVAVQKNPKTLSFTPFMEQFLKAFIGTTRRQLDFVTKDLIGENSDKGMVHVVTKKMGQVLAPGPSLDRMNQMMADTLVGIMDDLNLDDCEAEVGLWEWVRHILTMASTNAAYGASNPFKDPEIEMAFWTYEAGMGSLAFLPFPRFTARAAFNSREKIVKAYEKYFLDGCHDKDGAALVQVRYHGQLAYGIGALDTARYEVSDVIGILVNTVPSAYWMLLHGWTDPTLLFDLRTELDAAILKSTTTEGTQLYTLDVSALRHSCPLLLSTFQEMLRFHSYSAAARMVLEDTVLADRYLLRKGSMVQMPSAVLHADKNMWGDDSTVFNARRTLRRTGTGTGTIKESSSAADNEGRISAPGSDKTTNKDKEKSTKLHPAAFRSFGAAPWLCPGRHFATTEVLVFVASMLMRFEIEPATPVTPAQSSAADSNKAGTTWPPFPTTDGAHISTSVLPPDYDFNVRIRRREGVEKGARFEIKLSEGGGSFPLPV